MTTFPMQKRGGSMIRREDVRNKVVGFLKRDFPEVQQDLTDEGFVDEFSDLLYDLLVGNFEGDEIEFHSERLEN